MLNRYPLFLIACLLLFIQGCAVSGRVAYEDEEGQVPDDFFEEIRKHRTDTDWVLSQLGEPLQQQELANGVSLYTWQLARASYKHASLLIVLRYNTVARETEYFHLVSQNGKVKKYWRDQFSNVQLNKLKKYTRSSISRDDSNSGLEDLPNNDLAEEQEQAASETSMLMSEEIQSGSAPLDE